MSEIEFQRGTINKNADPDEFRLKLFEILREFIKQQDAEVRINLGEYEDLYLFSEDTHNIHIGSTCVHIERNVKVHKRGTMEDAWITKARIQLIPLDSINYVELTKALDECESEKFEVKE